MTADELNALCAPVLGRIGWPRICRWNPGYHEFQDDIGREVEEVYAAALIRCHVEDWWDDNQRHRHWCFGPERGRFSWEHGPGVAVYGMEVDFGEITTIDYPPGPTRLHALIAAANRFCDLQDKRAKAYLESRSEMARICREGKLP